MIRNSNTESCAPNACNLNLTSAHDADEHAHNLTNWQQEYDQITQGSFYGSIVELPMMDVQVFQEHTSRALRQSCKVWPDSIWMGIPVSPSSVSKINGLEVMSDNIMCRPGNCEFELMTPDDFDIFGIVVSTEALCTIAETQDISINWQHLNHHGRLQVPIQTLQAIRFVLNRMLSSTPSEASERLRHELVMMAVLEVLQHERPNPSIAPSYQHRKQVVDRVKQYLEHKYLEQTAEHAITITDLCSVANVSRRTLQYSFEHILGISPLQFLRMRRLNGVRRALYQSSAEQTQVADVAADWGFWHLSQFSKDYRQLFGERPSDTLQKMP